MSLARNRWLFKQPSRMRNRSHLHSSWRDLRAYQEARHAAHCTLHPSKPLHPQIVREHFCRTLPSTAESANNVPQLTRGPAAKCAKRSRNAVNGYERPGISPFSAGRLYLATEPYPQTVAPAPRRAPLRYSSPISPILFSDRASSRGFR